MLLHIEYFQNKSTFVQVLCESLTYNQGLPHTLRGQKISDCIHKYQPPFHEFQVLKVSVEKPGVVSIPQQKSPMMLVCLSSEGNHKLLVRCLQLMQRIAIASFSALFE